MVKRSEIAAARRGHGSTESDGRVIFREPERNLPLIEDADVMVCGGGPAGSRRHWRQFDAVARVTFGVAIHADSKGTNQSKPVDHGNLKMEPYDIPLRALIANDVDALILAGRCISRDFIAHAS